MKKIVIVIAMSLVALLIPDRAYAAGVTLWCDPNNPDRPANGSIEGLGTFEHWILQQEQYIPYHENRCPQTVGKVQFTQAPDSVAIDALVNRRTLFIGLNQPLGAEDWERAVPVHTAPLMIDGFVVTANIPCSRGPNDVLKLEPVSLAAIYSGVVTQWNDRLLLERNSWLATCGAQIKVSARKDEAWSSAVFKDYLSKRNPLFTPLKQRGRLGEWPATLNVQCPGFSEADMASCALRSGSISYMRYQTSVANGLAPVQLANGNNTFPAPAPPGFLWPKNCQDALLTGATNPQTLANSPHTAANAGIALDWSTFSMTYMPTGYAMCGVAVIIAQTGEGAGNGALIRDVWRDHMKLLWSDQMQDVLPDYGYAPLPDAYQNIIQSSAITAG